MHEQTNSTKSNFIKGLITGFVLVAVVGGVYTAGVQSGSGSTSRVSKAVPTTATPTAPAPTGEIKLAAVTTDDWIRGDKNAPITIVEFSDLECPFCKRFHPTMQQLMAEYDGKIRWVYRHFLLSSLHSKAKREAEATECAGELGGNDGFWAYVDRLFEITPSNDGLQDSQLPQIAEDVGLDRDKFQSCLDSGKYAQKVQDQYNQALEAGGRGTPYSIVVTKDGQTTPVQGALPYEQVKSIIESVL